MAIKKDTLDGLLAGRDPQAVFSKDGLFDELKKALAERVLNAEIDDHLDGEAVAGKRNSRNGYSKKRVLTETSKLDLRIPRDREGRSIRSRLPLSASVSGLRREDRVDVRARHDRSRDPGASARALWPGGLARSHFDGDRRGSGNSSRMAEPASGTDVSAGFLRRAAGQNPRRGLVRNKAVYVALGVTPEGTKDILGLWIETSEGAAGVPGCAS